MLMELGDDIVESTPFEMLKKIEQHLAADTSADEHDRLMHTAQNTKNRRDEDIDAYLSLLRVVQQQMMREKYPGIENERRAVVLAVC